MNYKRHTCHACQSLKSRAMRVNYKILRAIRALRANYKILRAMRANHKIACHEKKIWLEKFFRGSYDLENVILGQICVPGGKN